MNLLSKLCNKYLSYRENKGFLKLQKTINNVENIKVSDKDLEYVKSVCPYIEEYLNKQRAELKAMLIIKEE